MAVGSDRTAIVHPDSELPGRSKRCGGKEGEDDGTGGEVHNDGL